MSTVLTAEKMHIQDAPRRLRFWRPDAAAKTFTLPAWALIVLTLIAPITIVIVMSFTDYQLGNTEVRWVGLENYSTLVLGDDFLRALKNTVLYAVLTVPASVFVGLMLALLVNQVKIGSRVYRALFFLPVASTLVAMAIVWKYLLHDAIGPINLFLRWLGFAGIPFFSSPEWSMFSLAIIGVWQLAGFNMVLFLAGLTAIPSEIQDAATLDGADSFWRRLFTVGTEKVSMQMSHIIEVLMLTASAFILLFTKTDGIKAAQGSVFSAGMQAVVAILGIAWMGDTFIAGNMTELKGSIEHIVTQMPWLFGLALFVMSILLFSQAATIRALLPLGIALGISPYMLIALFPAVNGYFFIPNYPTVVAAINFDRTGTTRIGKYILNHSFMMPGLIATGVSVGLGLLFIQFI